MTYEIHNATGGNDDAPSTRRFRDGDVARLTGELEMVSDRSKALLRAAKAIGHYGICGEDVGPIGYTNCMWCALIVASARLETILVESDGIVFH